jgi:uncharacterized protein YndB with AHSA1/START domain
LLLLTGCGRSLPSLKVLAAQGRIDDAAPVLAHVQAEVSAPASRVWDVLTNAPAWPQWQNGVASVSAASRLGPHERFTWTTGGTAIHSEVQAFVPDRLLSWTGQAYTAKAVHVWTLTPLSPDRTLVRVDESMDGLLMRQFFSSRQLQESGSQWIAALKAEAEKWRR